MTVALYTVLATAVYYLASRAKLTEWLWRRYPAWLEYWTLCAACLGFWIGFGLAATHGYVGIEQPQGVWGLSPQAWYTPLVAGLTTMVLTPILAFGMVFSWSSLMDVDSEDAESAVPNSRDYENTIPLRPPRDD